MTRRAIRTALISIALVLSVLVVACEGSTTGANLVAPDDAATGEGGTTVAEGGGTSEPDAASPTLPKCTGCAVASCASQIEACGDACVAALDCFERCSSVTCQDQCLRDLDIAEGIPLKACLVGKCQDACPATKVLALGIQAYAFADCGRYNECAPATLSYNYKDLAECQQRALIQLLWLALLPGSGATGTRLVDCAVATAAAPCNEYFSVRGQHTCMIRGIHGVGAPCMDNAQCETGFCSKHDLSCGVCAIPPAPNAACVEGSCGWGMICNAANRCVYAARGGARCNAATPCEDPFFCTPSGFCEPLPAYESAACGSAQPQPGCDTKAGFICSSATNGICLGYSTSAPGGFCGRAGNTFHYCRHSTCTASRCGTAPVTGEACAATGRTCTYPDRCIDGKCTGLPNPGACE